MKFNKKLIAPICSLALLGSVVVGATAAWWSVEEEATVYIRTGQIDMSLNFNNLMHYSAVYDDTADDYEYSYSSSESFIAGGKGTINPKSESNSLSLDVVKMAPGDKVIVDVLVVNDSTIDSDLRLRVEPITIVDDEKSGSADDLSNEFVVKLLKVDGTTGEATDEVTFDSDKDYYSDPIRISAITEDSVTYTFKLSIELPTEVENGQNTSYSFDINALATQINTKFDAE